MTAPTPDAGTPAPFATATEVENAVTLLLQGLEDGALYPDDRRLDLARLRATARLALAAPRPAAPVADAPLDQLLEDAGSLLREPLDFAHPNTWADIRNARTKIAEAYKIVRTTAGRVQDAVTRFEVVDHRSMGEGEAHGYQRGRVFSVMPCRVELSFQDQGRTLKVFVDDARPAAPPPEAASP